MIVKAVDCRTNGNQGTQGLCEPNTKEIELEQKCINSSAHLMAHKEVVEGGTHPGSETGCNMDNRKKGDGDGVPRKHLGNQRYDKEDWHSMCQDVDGFVVPVGETCKTSPDIQERAVMAQHILVEPQVGRNFREVQQGRTIT